MRVHIDRAVPHFRLASGKTAGPTWQWIFLLKAC